MSKESFPIVQEQVTLELDAADMTEIIDRWHVVRATPNSGGAMYVRLHDLVTGQTWLYQGGAAAFVPAADYDPENDADWSAE